LVVAVRAAKPHDHGRSHTDTHTCTTFNFKEWVAQLMQGS
jgi:hypothetical protein